MYLNLEQNYSDDFIKREVDKANGFVLTTWLQHPSSEIFRQQTEQTVNFIIDNNLKKWLCDVSQVKYLNITDQNWLVRELFPKFKNSQGIQFAYVVSSHGFELMDTYRIHDLIKQQADLYDKIEIEVFIDKEMAKHWIIAERV